MKKILTMFLALCMILGLAACGGGKTAEAAPTAAPTAEPAAEATDAPSEETDDAASADAGQINWPEFITIGGGGSSATFYAVATAVAQLISDNTDCVATGQATNGGTSNMQMLQTGEIEFGMADQFTANMAYNGLNDFEGAPVDDLRAVAVIYKGVFAIQATPGSGIETCDDLVGKTVCVGMSNSGTETVTREVFSALGLDYVNGGDIKAEYMGADSGADLLRNGQADAMTFFAPIPDSSQTEIMLTADTHLVSLSDEGIAALTVEGSPLASIVIPADTYDGQTEDINTVYAPMILWTTADMDEDVVYEVTKMLYENLDTLENSNAVFGKITAENIAADISIPIHDGALRYYTEAGILAE